MLSTQHVRRKSSVIINTYHDHQFKISRAVQTRCLLALAGIRGSLSGCGRSRSSKTSTPSTVVCIARLIISSCPTSVFETSSRGRRRSIVAFVVAEKRSWCTCGSSVLARRITAAVFSIAAARLLRISTIKCENIMKST
jgi:hypothetical protein